MGVSNLTMFVLAKDIGSGDGKFICLFLHCLQSRPLATDEVRWVLIKTWETIPWYPRFVWAQSSRYNILSNPSISFVSSSAF